MPLARSMRMILSESATPEVAELSTFLQEMQEHDQAGLLG